jgi:hypothetical protein
MRPNVHWAVSRLREASIWPVANANIFFQMIRIELPPKPLEANRKVIGIRGGRFARPHAVRLFPKGVGVIGAAIWTRGSFLAVLLRLRFGKKG